MGFLSNIAPILGGAAGFLLGGPAGATLGASIGGGVSSAIGADEANKASQQSVREQMNFQERMARNSYQYAMEDMRSAGLNPILAYKQGGASTPAGASYTAQNVMAPMANMDQYLNSAQQRNLVGQQTRKVNMEVEKLNAEISKIETDTRHVNMVINKVAQEVKKLSWEVKASPHDYDAIIEKRALEVLRFERQKIQERLKNKAIDLTVGELNQVLEEKTEQRKMKLMDMIKEQLGKAGNAVSNYIFGPEVSNDSQTIRRETPQGATGNW